ncbi:RNA polymerase subunit sigma-70 [Pseudomonas gingeri NCPPB 3146 = LMG 5327]|uniref:Sigma-70 family RNA polymerase sigma factor n=2 Tax=Pseudomonas gingeri TaxID=117681 RepID=A0A7Y7Y0V1_9PSED|nr:MULTISPECIES: sigma-70 family RNA polymerase sigma factor [Pseudomonas]NVZ62247.1 sigma-70 family RNA polymerase sigma factor [Pseudomonas gingeri]NVZ76260.1 sigma-70 family RNA polymerase sigma factor [Pseudomonas gingeri]NWC14692.1 sigma-70 family RNA polymerase sigma factor [Pseudomonas gingeri]NWE44392.1 sigma-70 family RNA polymerase sigma factor [Pseudomonas gingeri]NWE67211.1 sigma-70 family RNA polymerase sigma factor [Pseudomonas gingeri]
MNGITPCRGLTSASKVHRARSIQRSVIVWRMPISTADADQLRQLLAQCSLGNRRAFETLYRNVAPRLHGIALRCMGRPDLAEEVLQESFVRIWNNASRYDANLSAPMTWMVNITRNLAIDQLRKKREERLGEFREQELPDDAPSAHDQLTSSRDASALNRCLDSLEGMQRQSITIAYFHGLSYAELAEQLAAPLGSVKSWIRRGMERLRRCLES